jgi:hypothetical protein
MRCNWLVAVAAPRAHCRRAWTGIRVREKPASCASRPSWSFQRRAPRAGRCPSAGASSACSRRCAHGPGVRAARSLRFGALAMCACSVSSWPDRVGEVAVDLRRALFETGLGLGQLERLDLRGVRRPAALPASRRAAPAELARGCRQAAAVRAAFRAATSRAASSGGRRIPASSSISRWRSITPWVLASGAYSVSPPCVSRWPARDTRGPAASGRPAAGRRLTATPASHSSSTPAQRGSVAAHLAAQAVGSRNGARADGPGRASVRVAGGGRRISAARMTSHRRPAPRSVRAARLRPRFPSRLRPGSPATGPGVGRVPRALSQGRSRRSLRDLGLQLRPAHRGGRGFRSGCGARLQGLRAPRAVASSARVPRLQPDASASCATASETAAPALRPLATRQQAPGRAHPSCLPVLLQPAATLRQVFQRAHRVATMSASARRRACSASPGAAGLGDLAAGRLHRILAVGQQRRRGRSWRAAAVRCTGRGIVGSVVQRGVGGDVASAARARWRFRCPAGRCACFQPARMSRKWPQLSDSSRLTSVSGARTFGLRRMQRFGTGEVRSRAHARPRPRWSRSCARLALRPGFDGFLDLPRQRAGLVRCIVALLQPQQRLLARQPPACSPRYCWATAACFCR